MSIILKLVASMLPKLIIRASTQENVNINLRLTPPTYIDDFNFD